MRTRVKKSTEERPHPIANHSQGSNGRSMPAVGVSQKKGDNPQPHDLNAGRRAKPTTQLKGAISTNVNTPAAKVVQLAGTKPNQPSADGQYRIKLSSEREAFTYSNRAALGLDVALPGHHPVTHALNEDGKMAAVKIAGSDVWIRLKEPIAMPGAGQTVLCIDTVGWEDESAKAVKDQKCVMDVKIGTYTKSTEQYDIEGANVFSRLFKKVEHNIKDKSRDSRSLGYDIDAGNLSAFLDFAQADATSVNLLRAMRAVKPKLAAIQRTMAAAPVTFVGSSLFMVFNMTDPAKSDVKLIDPDHPIVITPGAMVMPRQLIRRANFDNRWFASWDAYVRKWTESFGTGMTKFMDWFTNLSG